MSEKEAFLALAGAAEELHRAAAPQWNRFIAALKEAGYEMQETLLRAPPEHLTMAQSRARAVREILTYLEKA